MSKLTMRLKGQYYIGDPGKSTIKTYPHAQLIPKICFKAAARIDELEFVISTFIATMNDTSTHLARVDGAKDAVNIIKQFHSYQQLKSVFSKKNTYSKS